MVLIPSGASGANVNAAGSSGATVLAKCIRKANKGEDLFATTQATTGATTAYVMGFEGHISAFDVQTAMGS